MILNISSAGKSLELPYGDSRLLCGLESFGSRGFEGDLDSILQYSSAVDDFRNSHPVAGPEVYI